MHSLRGRRSGYLRAFFGIMAIGCMFQSSSTQGTAVRSVGLNEMLSEAALVFHGLVIDKRIARDANGIVMAHVRFEIAEIVKGEHEQDWIELIFVGGAIGHTATLISGQEVPDIGEEGIYFVESLRRQQINPLFGWNQGRFTIDGKLPDGRLVRSGDGLPVTTVSPAERPVEMRLSDGVAVGVLTLKEQPRAVPLTPEGFKRRLREMLRALP